MSGVSERANGQASGPVLQSVILAVLDHSGRLKKPIDWRQQFDVRHQRRLRQQ